MSHICGRFPESTSNRSSLEFRSVWKEKTKGSRKPRVNVIQVRITQRTVLKSSRPGQRPRSRPTDPLCKLEKKKEKEETASAMSRACLELHSANRESGPKEAYTKNPAGRGAKVQNRNWRRRGGPGSSLPDLRLTWMLTCKPHHASRIEIGKQ